MWFTQIFQRKKNFNHGTPVKIYTYGDDVQLAKNFHLSEFECKCNNSYCTVTIVSLKAIKRLQKVRDLFGAPVIVTSGYRCAEHNNEVGGVTNSRHMKGLGFDIAPNDPAELGALEVIARICFDYVQKYNDGHLHVHILEGD